MNKIGYLCVTLLSNVVFSSPTPLGINLEGLRDWSRSLIFVDLIKSSRKFGNPQKPWEGEVRLGAEGWPTEDFGVIVFTNQPGMKGEYSLSFNGDAEVKLVASSATLRDKKWDKKSNLTTATIDVRASANQLMLSFTKTNGRVKNLKLLIPGYPINTKEIFNKDFLKIIEPFPVLRFMDLLSTNSNETQKWEERAQKTDALQTSSKGIAIEYVVELANRAKKDIWFNVPYLADDNYVKNLALLLRKDLRQESKIYLELSNEIWNTIFKSHNQNKNAAEIDAKSPNSILRSEKEIPDLLHEEWNRVPKRLVEIIRIFEGVFGKDPTFSKVRPILASQLANPFMLAKQLEFTQKKLGPPKSFYYAIAGAPYFGVPGSAKSLPFVSLLDLEQMLKNSVQSLTQKSFRLIKNWDGKPYTANFPTLASHYELKYVAYEGGPNTSGEWELQTKIALNTSKAMGDLVDSFLKAWYGCGGDLFMYFNLSGAQSKSGSWGMYEDIHVPTAKSAAVLKILNTSLEDLRKNACQ